MNVELVSATCQDCSGTGWGDDAGRCGTCDGLGSVCDWEPCEGVR